MDNGVANNNFVVNDEQIKIISKGYGNYIFLAVLVLMSGAFIIPGGEGSMCIGSAENGIINKN